MGSPCVEWVVWLSVCLCVCLGVVVGVHLFIILSGGRRVGARPGAWEAVVYGFDVHRLVNWSGYLLLCSARKHPALLYTWAPFP